MSICFLLPVSIGLLSYSSLTPVHVWGIHFKLFYKVLKIVTNSKHNRIVVCLKQRYYGTVFANYYEATCEHH